MNKNQFVNILKLAFLSVLLLVWFHVLQIFIQQNLPDYIIIQLILINLLFLICIILQKSNYAAYSSLGVLLFLIIGCINIYKNYEFLNFFNTVILIEGVIFFILIFYFNLKLTAEKNAHELSIAKMSEDCNDLENRLEKEKKRNISFKIELARMEKMSHTSYLMGSSMTEKEAARHLVNETINILGVNKSLLSRFNKSDGKYYIYTNHGYPRHNNKLTDNIDDWIKESKNPILVSDVNKEVKIKVQRYSNFSNSPSIIAAPIMVANRVYGVLRAEHNIKNYFTNDDLRVLDYISDLGSIVFENLYYLKEIERLAITDGITGLYVHRYMVELLENEIERFFKTNAKISLIMMDIDNFKYFNDTYGHQVGDKLLIRVADIIKENIREIDYAVRYGGDEFVIILPQTDLSGCRALAKRLLEKVRTIDINAILKRKNIHEKKLCTISISIGTFKKIYKNYIKFLDRIDKTLYSAKRKGKNRIEIAK